MTDAGRQSFETETVTRKIALNELNTDNIESLNEKNKSSFLTWSKPDIEINDN